MYAISFIFFGSEKFYDFWTFLEEGGLNFRGKGVKLFCFLEGEGHEGPPSPPVLAKPNILYSKGSFVDIECWTVAQLLWAQIKDNKAILRYKNLQSAAPA